MLAKQFKGRPLVLLLDSDARKEALRIQQQLRDARARAQAGSRVVLAKLPEGGKDPADFSREVVLDCVAKALGRRPGELASLVGTGGW